MDVNLVSLLLTLNRCFNHMENYILAWYKLHQDSILVALIITLKGKAV